MPLERPPSEGSSPYREGAGPPRTAASPDIDPGLLRMQWWVPVGVVSGLWVPICLAMTWLTDMGVRIDGGPSRPMTLTEKSIETVALVLWLAVLLGFRARHRRRMRDALAALVTDNEAQGKTRADEIEPPRTRVELRDQEDDGDREGSVESEDAEVGERARRRSR